MPDDKGRIQLNEATTNAQASGHRLIRSERTPRIEDAFAHVSKKAAKFGHPPLTLTKFATLHVFFPARTVSEVVRDGHETAVVMRHTPEHFIDYDEVKVEGDAFQIAGWTPVLKMEIVEGGATFFEPLGSVGHEVPAKYREPAKDGKLPCEHCNMNRRRKGAFVVVNAQKEWKVVGSTCLVDFTGHKDAEGLANAIANYSKELRGLDEDGGWMSTYTPSTFPTDQVLSYAARYIRKYGWASRKQAQEAATPLIPTVDRVLARLTATMKEMGEMKKEGAWLDLEQQDIDLAASTRDAVIARLDKPGEAMNEFDHNLLVSLKSDACTTKIMGTVCALYAVAERYKTKEQQASEQAQKAAVSNHVGKEGERLDLELKIAHFRQLPGNDRFASVLLLYKFEDKAGNQFSWFTAKNLNIGEGLWFKAKASVKKHNEYRGVKETQITRLKVTEEPKADNDDWLKLSAEERMYRAAKAGQDIFTYNGMWFFQTGTVRAPSVRYNERWGNRDNWEGRREMREVNDYLAKNRPLIRMTMVRVAEETRAQDVAEGAAIEATTDLRKA